MTCTATPTDTVTATARGAASRSASAMAGTAATATGAILTAVIMGATGTANRKAGTGSDRSGGTAALFFRAAGPSCTAASASRPYGAGDSHTNGGKPGRR